MPEAERYIAHYRERYDPSARRNVPAHVTILYPFVPLARHEVVGEIPSPVNLPPGCFFAGRCPLMLPACTEAAPPALAVEEGHLAACIRVVDGTNQLVRAEEHA